MKFQHVLITLIGLLFISGVTYAGNLNTSGKCPTGTSCELGHPSRTPSLTLTTDGADFSIDATSNTATLTATTTATAVFTGADAAGAADTTYDTTGAGTVRLGSGDVLQIPLISDGGTVTIDGSVTTSPIETATFGAPNKMLQTTLATGFALHQLYVGIPKLGVTHIATLTNGGTSVAIATPLVAACNAIVNGAEADDTTNFITASSSYKYTWAAAVAADDGIDCVIAYPAVTDPISFGFWFRTDTVIVSGDIDINFDDGGVTDGTISTLAVTVLDEWQWIEMDITTACSGDCSEVDGIEFLATAQAATNDTLDDAIINIDQLAMWKAADEKAIGNIRVGGLIDFTYALKAQDQVNTMVQGVEWTSHFVNYQTGADAVISVTDLSAQYGTTLEALE